MGLDVFAWRRRYSYGSIDVYLEWRTEIDLLPNRQRDTVLAWLKEKQQVQIICRARANRFGAGGVADGDRWRWEQSGAGRRRPQHDADQLKVARPCRMRAGLTG